MTASESIERAAEILRSAERVTVLTGAGISAESGLATFRDKEEGLWSKYDPMELAHIDAFHRDPELVTRWYHWRFTKARDCEPNAGHDALAQLQAWLREQKGELTLITQNVDGLHQRAGAKGVIEIHGTILTWRCLDTGAHYELDDIDFSSFPPRSEAGGLLRPNVVWFGEMLPPDALFAAEQAVSACDVFMSIGTSAAVWPAAGFIDVARANGAATMEVNLDPTPITASVDVSLLGKCGDVLPLLLEAAKG